MNKKEQLIKKGFEIFSKNSYVEASTDVITKEANIAKGLLFHYFSSKKQFYLVIVEEVIDFFIKELEKENFKHYDFYEVVCGLLDHKFRMINSFKQENLLLNQIRQETSKSVFNEVQKLLKKYDDKKEEFYREAIIRSLIYLNVKKEINKNILANAIVLYSSSIFDYYLKLYEDKPKTFFLNFNDIKNEIKYYLDLFIKGIVD